MSRSKEIIEIFNLRDQFRLDSDLMTSLLSHGLNTEDKNLNEMCYRVARSYFNEKN